MASAILTVADRLIAAWPPERWRDVTVLAAVSGGADSVALVRALHQVRIPGEGRLVVAHFNHRLRGTESDADQAFVTDLAARLDLELIAGSASANLSTSRGGEGLEGAARQARYQFLTDAANQTGARYVATAHTADDQVETVLHNILRGTGLTGLAGIPRLRSLTPAATVVRPLISVIRTEVLSYLESLGQRHRDDSTNRLTDYTRNRIRHELLPLLERDYNPRVREALLRLAKVAVQADDFFGQQAEALIEQAARRIPSGIELDLSQLVNIHSALLRQALLLVWQRQNWPLQDMSLEKWEQLQSLVRVAAADSEAPGTHTFPGGIRAERQQGTLKLQRS